MDLTLYGDGDRGVIKLDPRTKVLIFLCCGLMTLSNYSHICTAVYTLLICIILALSAHVKTAVKAALVFMIVMYIRLVMTSSEGAPYAIVTVLMILTTLVTFSFPTLLSLILLVKTTKVSSFISAFQAMHIPVKVIVPFAVFFRFLPTVAEEWNGIRKAMAFRGISLSPVQIICHPWRTIEYILIPMLFSSISVMEELAAASMARGLDIDSRRSSYEEVRFKAADVIVILLFVAVLGLAFFLGSLVRGGDIR